MSIPRSRAQYSRAERRELFRRYLLQEDFAPSETPDGNLKFHSDRLEIVLEIEEDDEAYFRLTVPGFFKFDEQQDWQAITELSGMVNSSVKAFKCFSKAGKASAAVELIINPIQGFPDVFYRSLLSLHMGIHTFRQMYRALLNEGYRSSSAEH